MDSSSKPCKGTEPQHYIIKKQSGLMKSKDESLTMKDTPNLYALALIKDQLETMEKNLSAQSDETSFGKLCETQSNVVKTLHELIHIDSLIDEVIKHQGKLTQEEIVKIYQTAKKKIQKEKREL